MDELLIECNNYKIHYNENKNFKSNKVLFSFGEKATPLTKLHRIMLGELINEENTIYKTDRDFFKKSISLYNTSINHFIKTSGPSNTLDFSLTFLKEKYTEEGMDIKCLNFFKDMLFNSDFSNVALDKVKKVIKDDYIEINQNPSAKSMILARNLNDENSNYSYTPYFLLDQIDDVALEDIKKTYSNMLNNNVINIYCTGFFSQEFLDKLKNMFNSKGGELKYLEDYKELNKNDIKRVPAPFSQSSLSIICSIKNLNQREIFYIATIYNFILGGCGSSKLFDKVREENSLCYTIRSTYAMSFPKIEISAGIDADNFDRVVDLIKECLNDEITEEELIAAKNHMLSKYEAKRGKSEFFISNMISKELYGTYVIDAVEDKVNSITLDEINFVRKKIEINTIFLLEGVAND